MEKMGIIRAVSAEFIKCLNSMHLAPKEAGKGLGMTCEVLLCECNHLCQQYGLSLGLPDYWEETGNVETMETDDVEMSEMEGITQTTDDEPKAPPQKWRVCQAFHAVNATTQIPSFLSGN